MSSAKIVPWKNPGVRANSSGKRQPFKGTTSDGASTTIYRLHQGSEIRLHAVGGAAPEQLNDLPACGAEGITLRSTGHRWSEDRVASGEHLRPDEVDAAYFYTMRAPTFYRFCMEALSDRGIPQTIHRIPPVL